MARPRSDIRPRILRAAAERFLHDGVDGASLRHIADDARTSVGMVSYYFPTKDSLFEAVVEDKYKQLVTDIAAAFAPDVPFEAQLERLYGRFAAMDDDEFRVLRLVLREGLVASPRMPTLVERFSRGHIPVVLLAVARAMETGEIRAETSPFAAMLATVAGAMMPQVFRRLLAPTLGAIVELPSADETAKEMRRMLLHGIGAAAAERPATSRRSDGGGARKKR